MSAEVKRKKQLAGFYYGMAAGLAFSIFAWGIDAVTIAFSHGVFYWTRILPGLIISLLAGGFTGWLTTRLQHNLVGLIPWIGLALLLSRLMVWLPIRLAPKLVGVFNGAMGDYLKYPYYKSLGQNLWFGFAAIVIVAIICGLLENILIDQAIFSSGKFTLAVPLIVCFMSFSLVGSTADSLVNQKLRKPIVVLDDLLDFAVENIGKEVPGKVAREMHMGALNTVKDYLPRERRLILSNFDESMGQIDILVDFDGRWVKCTTIYDQVTMCKPALETPWNRLSNLPVMAWVLNLTDYSAR